MNLGLAFTTVIFLAQGEPPKLFLKKNKAKDTSHT
jgi:hypothetical protein